MRIGSGQQGFSRTAIIITVLVLVVIAGIVGWQIGKDNSGGYGSNTGTQTPANTAGQSTSQNVDSEVKELVSYNVPQGWSEKACPSNPDIVLLVPPNTSHDCDNEQTAPISISKDPQNRTDCNQLQNVQNVSKHICKSVFIDDHKTLQAETVYNQNSNYKEETRFAYYLVDTGKGVVKFEYIDRVNNSDDNFQEEFDQVVGSIGVTGSH